ncbi:hypothetical protein F5X96DRAFT_629104 [Biscogniauxia mediterranea]|nr:hypothetical protein F5X96DRAFT_629104 [Biscogniauxia mediterranea]
MVMKGQLNMYLVLLIGCSGWSSLVLAAHRLPDMIPFALIRWKGKRWTSEEANRERIVKLEGSGLWYEIVYTTHSTHRIYPVAR